MAFTKLKIGTTVVLIALVLLTGWFYYFYIAGPDAAIRHAEAFAFRRMTVTQLAEQGTYRFHSVTNRVAGENPEITKRAYTGEN